MQTKIKYYTEISLLENLLGFPNKLTPWHNNSQAARDYKM